MTLTTMSHLSIRENRLVWYNGLHYSADHLSSQATVINRFNEDLQHAGLQISDLTGKPMVLSFQDEGHDAEFANPLIQFAQSLPIQDLLVIFNTVLDTDILPYRAWSYADGMINHGDWFNRMSGAETNIEIDCKFICLMRRPSESRARLANKLLDSVSSLRMSFGVEFVPSILKTFEPLLPGRRLPLLLGPDIETNRHDNRDPIFRSCMFNVVVESSSQSDRIGWHTKFITEKTFKAFGFRQVPIWMAVPGLVGHIRAMGFDLFDDLIDHSYDHTTDEDLRRDQVVEQVKRLDQTFSLDQCRDLRKQLGPRLEHNYQLLETRLQQGEMKLKQILNEFLNKTIDTSTNRHYN